MSRRVQVPGSSSTSDDPAAAAPPPKRRGRGFLFWGVFGIGAIGAVLIGAFIGYWIFLNLTFSLKMQQQPMAITLPPQFEVSARIQDELDIIMDGVITAQVPFQQELTLPLRGRYASHVELDTMVPVRFDVHYDGVIPVDTVAEVEILTNFNYFGAKTLRNLPIRAKLPMQFSMPVQLTAPVDQEIRFRYEGPLVMNLDQNITTEVDTVIHTSLNVKQQVSAPVIAEIPLLTTGPPRPLRTIIVDSTISGMVKDIGLSIAEDTSGPKRLPSPWGPAEPPMAERIVIHGLPDAD